MTRQEAIDEAVRRVLAQFKGYQRLTPVLHGAFAVPSGFITDVRAEYRKIMQCQ